jgi:hypothetical protein
MSKSSYNPNQPRGSNGEWVASGSAGRMRGGMTRSERVDNMLSRLSDQHNRDAKIAEPYMRKIQAIVKKSVK